MSGNLYITESEFFLPEFNTAIFADPFRLYFSTAYESFGLDMYHILQKRFGGALPEQNMGKESLIFFLIYSEAATFASIFKRDERNVVEYSRFQKNMVVGINGSIHEDNLELVMEKVSENLLEYARSAYNPTELSI